MIILISKGQVHINCVTLSLLYRKPGPSHPTITPTLALNNLPFSGVP